jgi:hypothetical protein
MSLTSYRAAPPRVILCSPELRPGSSCVSAPGLGPPLGRTAPPRVILCSPELRPGSSCVSAPGLGPSPGGCSRAARRVLCDLEARKAPWLLGACGFVCDCRSDVLCWLGRPGSDLLSHVLRRSTIGAEGFHGRVRNGIGCIAPRHNHQVIEASKGCVLKKCPCFTNMLG